MIHPKVREFWEKQGYELTHYTDLNDTFTNWYVRKADSWKRIFVATTYKSKLIAANKYYFNEKVYSTEKILKIIKLKAFA